MRKLLVLALVLGIAGLANAQLSLVTGLTYEIDPVTSTISIIATEKVVTLEMGVLTPDAGILTPGTLALPNGGVGTNDPEAMGLTYYTYGTIVGMAGTTASSAGQLGTLYTFSYAGTGLVTISSENEWYLAGATVLFEVGDRVESLEGLTMIIPEPMTMLLLGLGGLFLRKR